MISIPFWSRKVLYNAGTRIYYDNNFQFPDRLEIEGPTNMTLKIVVGNFIVSYVQDTANIITAIRLSRPIRFNPKTRLKALMY